MKTQIWITHERYGEMAHIAVYQGNDHATLCRKNERGMGVILDKGITDKTSCSECNRLWNRELEWRKGK